MEKKVILTVLFLMILAWSPSGIYFYLHKEKEEVKEVTTNNIKVVTRERRENVYDIVVTLRGTTYQPVASQCDGDPLVTSDMTRVNLKKLKEGSQKLMAISYDVKRKYGFKFGDEFDIFTKNGDYLGRYVFCDHMNERIQNTVDLMIHPSQKPTSYHGMVIKRVKKG